MKTKEYTYEHFKKEYSETSAFINNGIENLYSKKPETVPTRLWDSMFYSLRAGGKRLRPVLCIKSAELAGLEPEKSLPLALGLEMIHTASLIHDDLPCMDNDSLRRGKPTNHVVYGESMALLAGSSLFLMGAEYPSAMLLEKGLPHKDILEATGILLKAAGASGIHGGQVLDMQIDYEKDKKEYVWEIAILKTASLIVAAVESGAVLAGYDQKRTKGVRDYGMHLGLAFQIIDDILDVQGNTLELGKTTGKDSEQDKITFTSTYGLIRAKELAKRESTQALECARTLFENDSNFFSQLVFYLQSRTS
jgi:geranylgeranyl diphosphate synthase type II